MLQAFIDDSGWDGKSPVFVLAGFIAKESQWEAFSDEWKIVLDLNEPRPIPVLKTKEAFLLSNRDSPFFGWTEAERDLRLEKFVRTINRHVEHGIVSVVPIELYKQYFSGKFNPDALDRPYFLTFFGIMTNLLRVAKEVHDDRIDIYFDTQGNESKALLITEYERFIGLAPPELRAISPALPKFECEQKFNPLQAADLLAWHMRRYFFDEARGKDPTKEQSNVFLANLFKPDHDVFDVWTEERIRDAADTISRSSWKKSAKLRQPGAAMTLPDPSSSWRMTSEKCPS